MDPIPSSPVENALYRALDGSVIPFDATPFFREADLDTSIDAWVCLSFDGTLASRVLATSGVRPEGWDIQIDDCVEINRAALAPALLSDPRLRPLHLMCQFPAASAAVIRMPRGIVFVAADGKGGGGVESFLDGKLVQGDAEWAAVEGLLWNLLDAGVDVDDDAFAQGLARSMRDLSET